MSPSAPVITVDGPSGSGKGTVSRRIATRLGWHLLDSGALYRLVALAGERAGMATVLVLTGVSTRDDLAGAEALPDVIVSDLTSLVEALTTEAS